MKIDLSGDEMDARLYNRDNGGGAAEMVVSEIRLGDANTPMIRRLHKTGAKVSARDALEYAQTKTTVEGNSVILGADDASEDLKKAANKVLAQE
jgi:hypothetical protein